MSSWPSFAIVQLNCQVSISVREEIFLHQPLPFLAWDMIWVVFAPFVLGSTQLLQHFLGSKKVAKKSKLCYHVLYVWVPQNSIFYIRQILLGSRAILGSSCELSPELVSELPGDK